MNPSSSFPHWSSLQISHAVFVSSSVSAVVLHSSSSATMTLKSENSRLTFYIVRCKDLECLSITREFRTSFSTTHAANQQCCKCNQRESSQTA